MLNQIDIYNILFLDVETVPQVYTFEELGPEMKQYWTDKTRFLQQREELTAAEIYERAGIYAEFGKIVCISTAIVHNHQGKDRLRVKSFSGHDEQALLRDFGKLLQKHYSAPDKYLCGHNVKEFDIPYIARRMLLQGLPLPDAINLAGKKPWEVHHLDTMELWKFGDYKHFTSLALLAHIFGIPTPKDDISGADVAKVYWEDDDLERIRHYCEKDTLTVANLYRRMKNLPKIEADDVQTV